MDTLPDTLAVGCDDGALYSVPGRRMIRPNYRRHHTVIRTVSDLKATLRAGPFAWPGGYAVYFVTADGALLSFDAVREEFRTIADAIRRDDARGGWRVSAASSTADNDGEIWCDHTGRTIE
jgi:hypothetical protein